MARKISGVLGDAIRYVANALIPAGSIIMWSGSAPPQGWALCDGGTYVSAKGANVTVPNLRDNFIIGVGANALAAVGGATSQTPVLGFTAISIDQMAAHNHGYSDPSHAHSQPYNTAANLGYGSAACVNTGAGVFQGSVLISANSTAGYGAGVGITIANNGSGQGHNHTSSAVTTLPPYYALTFIIRL